MVDINSINKHTGSTLSGSTLSKTIINEIAAAPSLFHAIRHLSGISNSDTDHFQQKTFSFRNGRNNALNNQHVVCYRVIV